MAIPGVQQPDLLPIGQGLRLRKYDGVYAFALPWYQDEDLLFLVDGKRTPYTLEKLGKCIPTLTGMESSTGLKFSKGSIPTHRRRHLLPGGYAHCHR